LNDPTRVLIVEARFYDALADALLEGAKDALRAQGVQYDVVTVPGALEVPTVIAMAEEAGARDALVEAFETQKKYENVADGLARRRVQEAARRDTAELDEMGILRAGRRAAGT
jgi:FixJ family two-component response regulator